MKIHRRRFLGMAAVVALCGFLDGLALPVPWTTPPAMGAQEASPAPAAPASHVGSALRVSPNGRHLVDPEGKPFFWLGDTAWLLFQMATRDDAELYLKTRARQRFTVIQAAVVMGEERVGGTLRPNVYGDLAFASGNPADPLVSPGSDFTQSKQYDYWDHADYLIERAAAHRLMLGLLPLFVGNRGDGYKYLKPDNAYQYGVFLGERYRKSPHVFWILGGDQQPKSEVQQEVWHELARGIAVGTAGKEDYGPPLMTYHTPESSSAWFHKAPWLDFNMVEVWGKEHDIYRTLGQDYRLTPVKPTGLGEGSYENGPQYPTRPIDALKVRKQAYWSYFAGGYHTYGNTDTWNFSSYKREATQDWKTALESPGAASLSVLAKLFISLEWWKLVPDPSVFESGAGSGQALNVALRSTARDCLLVYLAGPATVALRLDRMAAGKTARATWIDPRSGARTVIGEVPTSQTRSFSPPKDWNDAILLLVAEGG